MITAGGNAQESNTQAGIEPTNLHWWALTLLVISVCINYIDRGNLGVAAHDMARDLQFKPDQLGILLGSIFWTYSLCQPLAGKAVDRWNVNWIYAAGFFLWSMATLLTGLAESFGAILLLRLFLGAGESVSYPAYSKVIASSFPEKLLGTANGLIDAGSKLGPAIGVLVGVKMVNAFSWRTMFLAIGSVSLVWLIPWLVIIPRLKQSAGTQKQQPAIQQDWSPSYLELLRRREFWGTTIGLFGANYLWYFLLTWLPYYFESERHYTKDRLALFASLPFWAIAVASLLFGLLADRMVVAGRTGGRLRQTFVTIGLTGACVFIFPAVLVQSEWVCNLLVALSCVCMAAFSSNHWALTQTMAGPAGAAKWTGLENCIGNFAGVIAAYLSGNTLHHLHSFVPAFVLASAFSLVGAIGFSVVIGKAETVSWQRDLLRYEPSML